MRNIKINRLVLDNFKCHHHLELDFGGKNASIYGDNATGKTSVYDGLTWLLFGKDSTGAGEKNLDIKPLNADGDVADHDAITSVEAAFDVDGEEIVLKRTFREVWATKRGSAIAEYTGNVSDYYVDGVPMKKNLFDATIKDLIPEDVFRMLTSVSYFPDTMKWQVRRTILFDMAGTKTDREIMDQDPRFAPLIEAMGKLDVSNYKAKILHERKGLLGTRDEIPARISEAQRLLQDAKEIDVEGCNAAAESLWNTINDLNAQIAAVDSNALTEGKRLDLRKLKLDRDTLERENIQHRRAQDDGSGMRKELEVLLRLAKAKEADLTGYIERSQKNQRRLADDLNDLRNRWVVVNGEAFAGGVCPTCGQQLPFDQLKAKTAEFEQQKQKRLQDLEAQASQNKQDADEIAESIQKLQQSLVHQQEEIQSLESRLEELASGTKPVSDLDGYADRMKAFDQQISTLQDEIASLTADSKGKRDQLMAEQREATDRLKEVQMAIAKASNASQTEARIQQLKDEAKAASEKLEGIEQMLYLMEEFTRFKAGAVEKSINDLFRIATFRLFKEQANGGLEERCDVVYGGVPYTSLNNGMKTNIGIDVINTLSRHYGVTVPLFIDNAEAVTRLEPCNAQTIRLVVSESDKELRIE